MFQVRNEQFHPVGQHEGAMELAGGDAAMQIVAGLVVVLAPTNDQLVLLDGHFELIESEACDGEGDAQALRTPLIARQALDVVGRVAVGGLAHTVERTLDLVEAKEERAGQRWYAGHLKALSEATLTGPFSRRPIGRQTCRPTALIWALAVKRSRMRH